MPDELTSLLPQPGSLRISPPPHQRGTLGVTPITIAFLTGACLAAGCGLVLFGWHVLRVLAICMVTSLLIEALFRWVARRSHRGWESSALLIGVLLTCTLPATVPWYVAATGSLIAVLVGLCLPGGLGHYLWHPVVIGRLAVQMFFHQEMTPQQWPVLARNFLVLGDLSNTQSLPPLWSWAGCDGPELFEAWLVTRPVDILRAPPSLSPTEQPTEALAQLVRDHLPAWKDVLLGGAGGAIGEAAVGALLIIALLLMWRGILRWSAPLAAVMAAGITAAILPIKLPLADSLLELWLPGTALWQDVPVGLVYVAYHLLEGEFLFVLFLLASDISSSPLTSRGHGLAGVVFGVLTIGLRVMVGVPAAAYWALLVTNTLTPLINRLTRRRVYGT